MRGSDPELPNGTVIAPQISTQSQHSKELIMAIDPVCGMEVEERTTKETATHEGTTYYFCSKDCREEFQASPEDYIGGEEELTGT
jgi:YHS domain-containing protein